MTDDWHGQPGGYQRHRARGEDPCPACRSERNRQQAAYRAATGYRQSERNRAYYRARQRALNRLARENRPRYLELLREEQLDEVIAEAAILDMGCPGGEDHAQGVTDGTG